MIKSYLNISLGVSAHDRFEQFVVDDSRVTFCDAVTGDWNYLLQAELEDVAALDGFIKELKTNYPVIKIAASAVLHNCVNEKIA